MLGVFFEMQLLKYWASEFVFRVTQKTVGKRPRAPTGNVYVTPNRLYCLNLRHDFIMARAPAAAACAYVDHSIH